MRPDDPEPRLATYRAVMERTGRPLEIVTSEHHSRAAAYAMTRASIAANGCPDGLLCFNDDVALGAYRALHDLGFRVPQDVAIIGHKTKPIRNVHSLYLRHSLGANSVYCNGRANTNLSIETTAPGTDGRP